MPHPEQSDGTPAGEVGAGTQKEEFCRRFVDYMVSHGGDTFDDGTSIREYAEQAAPTYWDNPEQRAEGPEECADSDMSYWEEG